MPHEANAKLPKEFPKSVSRAINQIKRIQGMSTSDFSQTSTLNNTRSLL